MEKLDVTKLESPKDIPVGTILVQHWCNSSTFYKIVGTTNKSVLVVKMPSKQTRFEHEGGGTGYSYKLPDEDGYKKIEKAAKDFTEKYDVDPAHITNEVWEKLKNNEQFKKDWCNISSYTSYLEPIRKIVKPAKNGGFYIPGVHTGSWCGPMRLWDGEEVSDYYN